MQNSICVFARRVNAKLIFRRFFNMFKHIEKTCYNF